MLIVEKNCSFTNNTVKDALKQSFPLKMSEIKKSPAKSRQIASVSVTGKQEPVRKSASKSPVKSTTTPAKNPGNSPTKKTPAKKSVVNKAALPDTEDESTLQRENAELLQTNKDLQKKVDSLQEQVNEMRATIKSMKKAKTSGTVKGFSAISPSSQDEQAVKSTSKSPRKVKSAVAPSPKKSAKTITSSSTTDFLTVTPWKHVLKEYYANSTMLQPKAKLEFRDSIQSFVEDNLGRKTEIRCRFIDEAGHVDIGIPENLVQKFVEYHNKKVNAPKQTREEELEEILKNGGKLPKRRLTITSKESPVRKKNIKVVAQGKGRV